MSPCLTIFYIRVLLATVVWNERVILLFLLRHIDTGIESYLGFGVQGGCASIFPKGRPMGAPRKLGVNELLLHCHLEDDEDLIVQCQ